MKASNIKLITIHLIDRLMYYCTSTYITNDTSVYCLPNGPATLTSQKGLKGCVTKTMALTQRGTLYFWAMSAGFSGKPHGSAKIRCFTLQNEIHIYIIAKAFSVPDDIIEQTKKPMTYVYHCYLHCKGN